MPIFSDFSLRNLEQVHPDLVQVAKGAIRHFDFRVMEGYRSPERQFELYQQGRSKPGNIVTFIDGHHRKGKHNLLPAEAIDIVPYPVNWKDITRFHEMATWVFREAIARGVKIEWGGHWSKFKDYPHFQIILDPRRTVA